MPSYTPEMMRVDDEKKMYIKDFTLQSCDCRLQQCQILLVLKSNFCQMAYVRRSCCLSKRHFHFERLLQRRNIWNISIGPKQVDQLDGSSSAEEAFLSEIFSRCTRGQKITARETCQVDGPTPRQALAHFMIIMKQCKRLQLQVVANRGVRWSLSEQVTRSGTPLYTKDPFHLHLRSKLLV